MEFIGPVLLVVVFSFCGFLIWLSQRPPKEEKGFITFVQDEARKRNLRREDMPKFVFENFAQCQYFYCAQTGQPLMLSDVQRTHRLIISSYKEKS